MAILKDYLGSLVRDLNEARHMADVETARIAEIYANDPVLKHFSVPRMKILETELTIPVAVDQLEHSTTTEYDPIDNHKLYTAVYNELKNTTETKSFNSTMSNHLKKSIYNSIDELETEIKGGEDTDISINKFANSVATTFISIIESDTKEKVKYTTRVDKFVPIKSTEIDTVSTDRISKANQFQSLLETNMKKYLVQTIKPLVVIEKLENAHVTTESAKLKEYSPQSIIYIKMKVTEESMEWQTMLDDDGEVVSKLIAE